MPEEEELSRLEYLMLLVKGYRANGNPIPRAIKREYDRLATAEATARIEAMNRRLREQLNWKPDE